MTAGEEFGPEVYCLRELYISATAESISKLKDLKDYYDLYQPPWVLEQIYESSLFRRATDELEYNYITRKYETWRTDHARAHDHEVKKMHFIKFFDPKTPGEANQVTIQLIEYKLTEQVPDPHQRLHVLKFDQAERILTEQLNRAFNEKLYSLAAWIEHVRREERYREDEKIIEEHCKDLNIQEKEKTLLCLNDKTIEGDATMCVVDYLSDEIYDFSNDYFEDEHN